MFLSPKAKRLPIRKSSQIVAKIVWKTEGQLFQNLKFTRFDDLTSFVSDLIDIDTPMVITQIDLKARGHVSKFLHFSSHEIENTQG